MPLIPITYNYLYIIKLLRNIRVSLCMFIHEIELSIRVVLSLFSYFVRLLIKRERGINSPTAKVI